MPVAMDAEGMRADSLEDVLRGWSPEVRGRARYIIALACHLGASLIVRLMKASSHVFGSYRYVSLESTKHGANEVSLQVKTHPALPCQLNARKMYTKSVSTLVSL